MDRSRRVNAGDRIRIHHETWNEIVDATVSARRGGVRGGPADLYANRQTILVRNMSGSALDLGAIVALSEPVIDPADDANRFVRRVVMDVITPTSTTASKFAVLVEPLASGAMGHAVADGLAICKVRYDGVSAKDYAEPRNGSTVSLDNVATGVAVVVWMADTGDSSNDRWAVVRIGEGPFGLTIYDNVYETTRTINHLTPDPDTLSPAETTPYGPNLFIYSSDANPTIGYYGQAPADYEIGGYITGYSSDGVPQVIGGWKHFTHPMGFADPTVEGVATGSAIGAWLWGDAQGARNALHCSQGGIAHPSTTKMFTVKVDIFTGLVFDLDPDGSFGGGRYGHAGQYGVSGTLGHGATVSGGIVVGAGSSTLSVSAGGTGVSTIPQYAVVIGAGTGAIQTAAPGTAGGVLMSNGASANPSFQAITDAHISGGIDCGTW